MARYVATPNDVITSSTSALLSSSPNTVAFWVYVISFDPGGGYRTLYCKRNVSNKADIYAAFHAQQLALYYNNETSVVDTTAFVFSINTWYHIVVTYDASNRNDYINGVLDNSGPSTGAITGDTAHPLTIGNDSSITTRGADCRFADFAVWNAVLTPLEIAALAKGVRPYRIRPGSLVGYLPLDGLQSPEPDLSGKAFNGTLSGTASAFGPPTTLFTRGWRFEPPVLLKFLMPQCVT